MKIKASARFAKIAPSKARPFARLLKGRTLEEALHSSEYSSQKGARLIGKVLKSMVANLAAGKLNADDFRVENVIVEQGPTAKRFWPRSRGMARPVVKRTCHIRVVLTDNKEDRKE